MLEYFFSANQISPLSAKGVAAGSKSLSNMLIKWLHKANKFVPYSEKHNIVL